MPLDGLRAWIGEVERKLGMRTRVFLVLSVIAIGASGAAIYLALDAHDSAVSEGDVQALQEDLEAQIAEGGAGGGSAAQLETELQALREEVAELQGKAGTSGKDGGTSGGGASGGANAGGGGAGESPGGTGGEADEGGGETGADQGSLPDDTGGGDATSGKKKGGTTGGAKLGDLLQEAKEKSEKIEQEEKEGK